MPLVTAARARMSARAMSVSFGFGGSCASLMFEAWNPADSGRTFETQGEQKTKKSFSFRSASWSRPQLNAVIESPLDTDFTCGVSLSAAAIAVRGDMVVIGAR